MTERNPVLTPAQRHTLEAVVDLMDEMGESPTVREVAEACGVQSTPAYSCLQKLKDKGFISIAPSVKRGIDVTLAGYDALKVGA